MKKHVAFGLFNIALLFLGGCQNNAELYWYKAGKNLTECAKDWSDSTECSFDRDCMYQKGYRLFKRHELPRDTLKLESSAAGLPAGTIPDYGVAGVIDPKLTPPTGIYNTNETQSDVSNKTGDSYDCYDLGYRWARCATLVMIGFQCLPEDDFVIPVECRGQETTRKGLEAGARAVYREHGLLTE